MTQLQDAMQRAVTAMATGLVPAANMSAAAMAGLGLAMLRPSGNSRQRGRARRQLRRLVAKYTAPDPEIDEGVRLVIERYGDVLRRLGKE